MIHSQSPPERPWLFKTDSFDALFCLCFLFFATFLSSSCSKIFEASFSLAVSCFHLRFTLAKSQLRTEAFLEGFISNLELLVYT